MLFSLPKLSFPFLEGRKGDVRVGSGCERQPAYPLILEKALYFLVKGEMPEARASLAGPNSFKEISER